MKVRTLVSVLLLILPLVTAYARGDGNGWENSTPFMRDWFQHLMQPDNPTASCCGVADAVEADRFESVTDPTLGPGYAVVITSGKGLLPDGTVVFVPQAKVQWQSGNPTGHGVLFIGPALDEDDHPIKDDKGHLALQIYCYVLPALV